MIIKQSHGEMSTIEKLKNKLKTKPKTFTFAEAKRLLEHEGYMEDTGGKTSGSSVQFVDSEGIAFTLHRPHPGEELKKYVILNLAKFLESEGKL